MASALIDERVLLSSRAWNRPLDWIDSNIFYTTDASIAQCGPLLPNLAFRYPPIADEKALKGANVKNATDLLMQKEGVDTSRLPRAAGNRPTHA